MIRPAKIEDLPYVLELIQELADFEKEPQEVEITLNTLEEDGFGAHAKFHCFVADVDEKIVGMALVYPRYSTWKGTVLHLEDLIVKASKRGRGIGSQLLDAVVRYGKELQVKRISWEVLECKVLGGTGSVTRLHFLSFVHFCKSPRLAFRAAIFCCNEFEGCQIHFS